MASSSRNRPKEDDLQATLRYLKLNSESELNPELLLKPAFVNAWRDYRDKFLWSADALGGKGPTMKTTIDDAVDEVRKRGDSTYIPAVGEKLDTSHFEERDHLICLIVTVGFSIKKQQSLISVSADVHAFVQGMITLVRLLRFQYNPSRRGRLAKELNNTVGESVHRRLQAAFQNKQTALQTVAQLRCCPAGFQKRPEGSFFTYKLPTGDNIEIPLSEADVDPRAPRPNPLSGILGATLAERQKYFAELVNALDPIRRAQWDRAQRLRGTNGPAVERFQPGNDLHTRSGDEAVTLDSLYRRLRIDKIFEEELECDGTEDRKPAFMSSYIPITEAQKEEFDLSQSYLNGHASSGMTTLEARQFLGIGEADISPRVPGMRHDFGLKDHQIEGIAWLLKKLTSPLKGGILADMMGLGKTVQILSSIHALITRASAVDDVETFGEPGPVLIIVPSQLIKPWVEAAQKSLPPDVYSIFKYDSSVKDILAKGKGPLRTEDGKDPRHTFVISSYEIMQTRHSASAHKRKMKSLEDTAEYVRFEDWDNNLRQTFWLMAYDEAHNLKSGQGSKVWQTICGLGYNYNIVATGTPVLNQPIDGFGLTSILVRKDLWGQFGLDPLQVNPFEFSSEDPKAVLQCTSEAFHKWMKSKDLSSQGEMLAQTFKQCLLARKYKTIINGNEIGMSIPPLRTEVVNLKGTEDQHGALKVIMNDCRAELIKSSLDSGSGGGVIGFVPHVIRKVTQASLWFPFVRMTKWDGCKTIRKIRQDMNSMEPPKRLRALLDYIQQRDENVLQFNPAELDDDELVVAVLAQAPKLQYLIGDVATNVILLRRKLIIWVAYPWPQLLVEVLLQASGFAAAAYHAHLKVDQQKKILHDFCDSLALDVFVGSYSVASEGLNLQAKCSTVICLQQCTSDPRQLQAVYRVRRLNQTKEQTCLRYRLRGSLDLTLFMHNMRKDFPATFAFINKAAEQDQSEESDEDANGELDRKVIAERAHFAQWVASGFTTAMEDDDADAEDPEREAKRQKTQDQRRALLDEIQGNVEIVEAFSVTDEMVSHLDRQSRLMAIEDYTQDREKYLELFGEDDDIARYGPAEDQFGNGSS
ncbi:SNF2 family N-terminal domain-containing protein [Phyllosticta capitalensis]